MKSTTKTTLYDLLRKPERPVILPGVFNAITALLAQKAGFEALYLSGAGLSNALLGKPDVGILTLEDIAGQVRRICSVARLALAVDIDTGFGGPAAVAKAVRRLEAMGASAVQIEDQVPQKRCGHLPGKELIGAREMCDKISAAARARSSRRFLIIARTDARGVAGFDEAVSRAQLYRRAGADILFPEALESRHEFKEFARRAGSPVLANMTEFGRTPYFSVQEFRRMGYDLVIFPMTAFRIMMKAAEDCLVQLRRQGTQKGMLRKMQTRRELYDLLGYAGLDKISRV